MSTTIHFKPLGEGLKSPAEYPLSDINGQLTRSNFFDGRLLTAEDLTREQVYIDERLRELGRVYGQGIIDGLQVQLASGQLTIYPGQALSSSGRVLLLGEPLNIDLNNAAQIRLLNHNKYHYIDYGLYAIVLQYAEQSREIAEVFPTQLSKPEEPQANIIVEGVSVSLIKLSVSLNQQDPYAIREQLIAAEGRHQPMNYNLPEDSVALGIIAFDNNSPAWLDSELLRQPVREEITEQSINEDFFRRHYKLYRDIIEDQKYTGVNGKLQAKEFFSTLPPVGPVPRAAINTNTATQSYFPDNYTVSIVPVNYNELNTILSESMSLSPLLLDKDEAGDIMILAPLQEHEFLTIARKMEGNKITQKNGLPEIQPLLLSPGMLSISTDNSDKTHWDLIWNRLEGDELYYIKRPQRAAETGVSAIVLARGAVQQEETGSTASADSVTGATTTTTSTSTDNTTTAEPAAATPWLMPSLAAGNNRLAPSGFTPRKVNLLSEDETLLRFVNFDVMAKTRPPRNSFEKNALAKLMEKNAQDSQFMLHLMTLLMFIDRRYDTSLWRTMLQLANKGDSRLLISYLTKAAEKPVATASLILKAGKQNGLPLTDSLKAQWLKLSAEE